MATGIYIPQRFSLSTLLMNQSISILAILDMKCVIRRRRFSNASFNTVLDPVLFIIYIDGFINSVHYSQVSCYVDDSQLFILKFPVYIVL